MSQQGARADALVVHTTEVQRALNTTLLTIAGAESALRGFLLTGNEAFLEPHKEISELLPKQLAELRSLIADDPEQLANLEVFASLIKQRLADIDAALAAQRAGRRADAIAALQRTGLPTVNDIRSRIEAAYELELSLLAERQSAAAELRERFSSAVLVMLLACGVLSRSCPPPEVVRTGGNSPMKLPLDDARSARVVVSCASRPVS